MSKELGAWLRQQREDLGWTRPEMARQLIKVGQARGDTSMPGMDSMCHNLYRWERGTVGLSERYKLYYCMPSASRLPTSAAASPVTAEKPERPPPRSSS